MQGSIQKLFSDQADALAEVSSTARQAEILIETISPVIEAYTVAACPECASVCCVNRHSRFDRSDLIFMAALGIDIPDDDPLIADTDACRFLGMQGCLRKRSRRPYRCTWFFCESLMEQIMRQTSAPELRKFMELLQKITERRTTMITAFEAISEKLCRLPEMRGKDK